MKLFYATNFWSHHQGPIAAALANRLGPANFRLGLFRSPGEEQLRMGWDAQPPAEPWILGPPRVAAERAALRQACLEADVAVLGDTPIALRLERARSGRLTFLMTERTWKKRPRPVQFLNPFFVRWVLRHRAFGRCPNAHCLAIGSGADHDERRTGTFGNRFWRWGYFADVPPALPARPHRQAVTILWAGRMIGLKHVDVLLRAAPALRDHPQFGGIRLVGDGVERRPLESLAHALGVHDRVRFDPPLSPADVRQAMADADIFVLPSDRTEGWGMVLSEAMSEGCVAVANEEAGASRVLIREGVTGHLFPNGSPEALARILCRLLADPEHRQSVGRAAWLQMKTVWAPQAAAERLVALCAALISGAPAPAYDDGPCVALPNAGALTPSRS